MAKLDKKPTIEVVAPKQVPYTSHKLIRNYGDKKVGEVVKAGYKGVQFLKLNKYIK
jgi:hypothetical protein|tara:strand:+ start:321 stop:488 length:168 start_codon:yes stop_codon:yes gene_type:complete